MIMRTTYVVDLHRTWFVPPLQQRFNCGYMLPRLARSCLVFYRVFLGQLQYMLYINTAPRVLVPTTLGTALVFGATVTPS